MDLCLPHPISRTFIVLILVGLASFSWGKEPVKERLFAQPPVGSSGVLKGYAVKPPNAYHPIEYPKLEALAEAKSPPPIYRHIDSLTDFIKVTETAKALHSQKTRLESPFQKKPKSE